MIFSGIKRVLTFYAHPDDEVLGAGGTLAKLSRLDVETHVAIPATGIRARTAGASEDEAQQLADLQSDCARAMGCLGIKRDHVRFGEFSDNAMDRHTLLELIQWLEGVIADVKPEAILTHHRFCTNIDHQYCHEAAVVATRPAEHSHVLLLAGEVPSSTGYLKPSQWEPNLFVELSPEDLDAKVAAMQAYRGEARPDPHPRSPEVLRALAKVRGSESGYLWAEAFMVQKAFA